MVLSLAGSVSDVTPAALDAMRQAVAAEAGVPVAAVTASVVPGSVLLTFRIALQTEGEADAAAVALAEHVGDADAASTWLGAASGLAITVTEVITPPTKLALQPPALPPSPAPPPPSPPPRSPPPPLPSEPPPSPSLPLAVDAPAADATTVEAGAIAGPIAGAVIVGLLAVIACKCRDKIKAKVGGGVPKLSGNESRPSLVAGTTPTPQPTPGTAVIPVDTTGDGQFDSIMIDTTGDGRPDMVVPTVQRPAPAPVPVYAGTIVDPPAYGTIVSPPAAQAAQDTPNEVTSVVELVRTPLGLGLSIDGRNKVTAIDDDSQAGRTGLFAVHDRLVSLNGQPLSSSSPLEELLDAVEVGGKLSFEIARQVKARKV